MQPRRNACVKKQQQRKSGGMTERQWRATLNRLREDANNIGDAQDLLLSLDTKLLRAASTHLPPRQVAEDILFLVGLGSNVGHDISNLKAIYLKICSLIVDVNAHAILGSLPAYGPSVLHFVEKGVEFFSDIERNLGASHTRFDGKGQRPMLDMLKSLGQILHDCGGQLMSDDVTRVTVLLLRLINHPKLPHLSPSPSVRAGGYQMKSADIEQQRLACNALANLLAQVTSLLPTDTCLEVVKSMQEALDLLINEGKLVVDSSHSRLYSGVLRCIQLSFADIKISIGELVAGLVTSLLHFFDYGLGVSNCISTPHKADERFREAQPKEEGRSAYRPPHLRRFSNKATTQEALLGENIKSEMLQSSTSQEEKQAFPSDSEHSDSDGSLGTQDRFSVSKTRFLAISIIQTIARADPKSLHAHWLVLFPTQDIMASRRLQNSLLKTLLYDPILKVRMAAAATISAMLEGPSRAFIRMAEYRDVSKTGSFTSLSYSLGLVLMQLQRGLTYLTMNEPKMGLLVASLKSLSLFIAAVPFSRLPNELLLNIMRAVQRRLKGLMPSSADQASAVCMALDCLSSAFSTVPTSDTVAWTLYEEVSGRRRDSQLLLDIVELTQPHNPSLVRVEALQALKSAVHGYPAVMVPWWSSITLIKSGILKCATPQSQMQSANIGTCDEKVVHAATKLLNEFLRAVSGSSSTDESQEDMQHQIFSTSVVVGREEAIAERKMKKELADASCWDESLQEYFPFLVAHPSALVRTEAMTCFAGLTFAIYSSLANTQRSFIAQTVLGMAEKDDSPSVRSAACRAIGVLVSFPSVIGWTDVLMSAMHVIIDSTKDASLVVRITASWALANLCDALRCGTGKDTLSVHPSLSFTPLAECAMRLCKDNDKVRANAVRALGNLTRSVNFNRETETLSTELRGNDSWLERIVQTFVSCVTTGNVKVQWNACHALGNLFLNKSINIRYKTWASSVFTILLLLLRDSKNFKIRIQAASALGTPKNRQDYGDSFYDVLQALVLALDSLNSNEELDSSAYKYTQFLNEQLCSTCLHVLGLIMPEDYIYIQDFLLKRAGFLEWWLRATFTAASVEHAGVTCHCIENEASQGTSTSHMAMCWIHREKALIPPRDRIWYAMNEREPLMPLQECLSRRKDDVKRVVATLMDIYTNTNQAKSVATFEQLLTQCS